MNSVDHHPLMVRILDLEDSRYDPWFQRYYGWMRDPLRWGRYRGSIRQYLDQAGLDPRGKSILDCGGGFGMLSLQMSLAGAAEVHSVEVHEGMVRTNRAYLERVVPSARIFPLRGDVSRLPYVTARFDALFCIEAISHFREVDRFLAEAARVLKPGGVMFISDGNNGASPRIRSITHEIWKTCELGPATDDIHGHRVPKPFQEIRADMIRERYPDLPPEEVETLARHTSGLWQDLLFEAVDDWRATGRLPDHVWKPGTCPMHPELGYYIEWLFDPPALARRIEEFGFRAHFLPHFGGARGGLVRLANDVLTSRPLRGATIPFAKAFRVTARRTEGGQAVRANRPGSGNPGRQ